MGGNSSTQDMFGGVLPLPLLRESDCLSQLVFFSPKTKNLESLSSFSFEYQCTSFEHFKFYLGGLTGGTAALLRPDCACALFPETNRASNESIILIKTLNIQVLQRRCEGRFTIGVNFLLPNTYMQMETIKSILIAFLHQVFLSS